MVLFTIVWSVFGVVFFSHLQLNEPWAEYRGWSKQQVYWYVGATIVSGPMVWLWGFAVIAANIINSIQWSTQQEYVDDGWGVSLHKIIKAMVFYVGGLSSKR